MQNTLLSVQSESQSVDINEQLEASLDSLHKLGHVKITGSTESRKIEVTHLGQATFKGLEKKRKRKKFVLAKDLVSRLVSSVGRAPGCRAGG